MQFWWTPRQEGVHHAAQRFGRRPGRPSAACHHTVEARIVAECCRAGAWMRGQFRYALAEGPSAWRPGSAEGTADAGPAATVDARPTAAPAPRATEGRHRLRIPY